MSIGDITGAWEDRRPSLPVSIVAPTVAIILSETLLFAGYTTLALWGHLLTVLLCVFAPPYVEGDSQFFYLFALVPLFRIVNLGMPIFAELTLYWYPLVYAPLIPGTYLLARAFDIEISFNPRLALVLGVPAALFGALLAGIEYAIIEPGPLIPTASAANLALLAIVMFGFVGFVEELLFRGVLQEALEDRIGERAGLLLASFLFGMMHSAYSSGPEIFFAAAIGLLFGLIYNQTRSLGIITISHGALNVFLFGVIPHSDFPLF